MYDSAGHYYSTYELRHHGILGQKWGVRRFQNKDGTLTKAGMKRYYKINVNPKDGWTEFTPNDKAKEYNLKQREPIVKAKTMLKSKVLKDKNLQQKLTEYKNLAKKCDDIYKKSLDEYLEKYKNEEDGLYKAREFANIDVGKAKESEAFWKKDREISEMLRDYLKTKDAKLYDTKVGHIASGYSGPDTVKNFRTSVYGSFPQRVGGSSVYEFLEVLKTWCDYDDMDKLKKMKMA